jgi:predicted transcriptional regulator
MTTAAKEKKEKQRLGFKILDVLQDNRSEPFTTDEIVEILDDSEVFIEEELERLFRDKAIRGKECHIDIGGARNAYFWIWWVDYEE